MPRPCAYPLAGPLLKPYPYGLPAGAPALKLACGEAKLPEALKASEGTEEASLGLAVTGGMPETDRRAAVGDEARLPVPGRPDPTGPDTARLSELVRRRGLPPVPITAGVEVWRVSLGRGRSSMDENDTLRGRMELSDGLTEACHGTVIQGISAKLKHRQIQCLQSSPRDPQS